METLSRYFSPDRKKAMPTAMLRKSRGMPHTPFRHVLNTLLYILISGCRWCDIPQGKHWASKSSAHRWLKRWQEDGTLERLQSRILGIAQNLVVSQIISRTRIFPRGSSNLGGHPENLIDEGDLSHDICKFHILNLSLTNHVHRFVAFNSSSS